MHLNHFQGTYKSLNFVSSAFFGIMLTYMISNAKVSLISAMVGDPYVSNT